MGFGRRVTSLNDNLQYLHNEGDAPAGKGDTGNRLVVVLGMHRSGTSAVAGALVAAGAWAGEPDELMPSHPENAFGYFERLSTATALDALLLELGGTWSSPPLDNLHASTLRPHRATIQRLISDVVARAPAGALPLVKDPRLTLFASELAAFLGEPAKVILCVRHPIEVARSLLARDSIPIQIGLALWESYNVAVCSGFAGRAVQAIRYDQLLDEPEVLSGVLRHTLCTKGRVPESMYEAAARTLSKGLRHQRVAPGDEEGWMSLSVTKLWRRLDEAAQAHGALPLEHATLSRASHELLVTRGDLSRVSASPRTLEEARAEIERMSMELTNHQDELRVVLAQRDALTGDIEEARTTNESLGNELTRRQGELHTEVTQRETLTRDLEAARTTNENLGTELARHQGKVRAVLAQRDALTGDLEEVRATNESLGTELARHEDELRAVLAQRELLTGDITRARIEHERLAAELEKQEEALRTALIERERLKDDLTARVGGAESECEQALGERDAAADALTVLQRHANKLAEDAATYLERSRHLETKLTRIDEELGSTLAELTAAHDHREQLAVDLEQKNEELADALHRSLVASDHARGFVESLRSVVGDLNPDAALDSLDEEELVMWVTLASQEREALRDANATLLDELDAINGHRQELVADLTAMRGSESWKIGRTLTWPVRLLRRRPHPTDNRNSENAEEDESSSSD